MTLNVTEKVNSHLKFLHRQNCFLTPPLRRPLCNALIQPLFSLWLHSLVSKSLKETKSMISSNAK